MKRIFYLYFSVISLSLSAQKTDTVVDIRDGNKYLIVQINNKWWMAENLNYSDTILNGETLSKNNKIIEKYCYENNVKNCDSLGGLYQLDEALNYKNEKDICMEGWHIPNDEEWQELESYFGIKGKQLHKLKWRNTSFNDDLLDDFYIFNSQHAGFKDEIGTFHSKNLFVNYWTSSKYWLEDGIYRSFSEMEEWKDKIERNSATKKIAISVRCIID